MAEHLVCDQCAVLTKCPVCKHINEHNVRQKEMKFAFDKHEAGEMFLAPCIVCRCYRSQSLCVTANERVRF